MANTSIQSVVSANGIMLVACDNGTIYRYDESWRTTDPTRWCETISVQWRKKKSKDPSHDRFELQHLSISPNGRWAILSLRSKRTFVICKPPPSRSGRDAPSLISELREHPPCRVTAVAWDYRVTPEEETTGEVLIGSTSGKIYVLSVDRQGRRLTVQLNHLVHLLPKSRTGGGRPTPVTALDYHTFKMRSTKQQASFILIAAPAAIRGITGVGTAAEVLATDQGIVSDQSVQLPPRPSYDSYAWTRRNELAPVLTDISLIHSKVFFRRRHGRSPPSEWVWSTICSVPAEKTVDGDPVEVESGVVDDGWEEVSVEEITQEQVDKLNTTVVQYDRNIPSFFSGSVDTIALSIGDRDGNPPGAETFLNECHQCFNPSATVCNDIPRAAIATDNHFIIFFPNQHIQVMSAVSRDVVMLDSIQNIIERGSDPHSASMQVPTFLGACVDGWIPSERFLFSDKNVWRLAIDDQRNLWRHYLQIRNYDQALIHSSKKQRWEVAYMRAGALKSSQPTESATQLAKTPCNLADSALKFIASKEVVGSSGITRELKIDRKSLLAFLTTRLNAIDIEKASPAQSSMLTVLATWILQLHLAAIGDTQRRILASLDRKDLSFAVARIGNETSVSISTLSQMQVGMRQSTLDATAARLRSRLPVMRASLVEFITQYGFIFNVKSVYRLLSELDNVHAFETFAGTNNDYDSLLSHFIREAAACSVRSVVSSDPYLAEVESMFRERDNVKMLVAKSLMTLRDCSAPKTLPFVYSFSVPLLRLDPPGTSSMMIAVGKINNQLSPKALMPALMQAQAGSENMKRAVIEFLKFAVSDLRCQIPSIHNFLLSLHVSLGDERAILDMIAQPESQRSFSPTYALMLCRRGGLSAAAAGLYGLLGLHAEAVRQGLKVGDLTLARHHALSAGDERDGLLRECTRYAVERNRLQGNVGCKGICDALDEVNFSAEERARPQLPRRRLVRVEDILPHVSGLKKVDSRLKRELFLSLETYQSEVTHLKDQMNVSTASTDLIYRDISRLRRRFVRLEKTTCCQKCEKAVLLKPLVSFVCGHHYHVDCLLGILKAIPSVVLQDELTEVVKDKNDHPEDAGALDRFDELLTRQCPLCGEYAVISLDKDLVTESLEEEWGLELE
eukprot:gnl/Dysnectes_brevis/3517_a4463_1126.p1 GENE.gnl/Dysnectes_brevis/3517_a4463_1126~~gnl/Dysnectes_brevis/3517_a4463_1126.p1  ORF type:complete len:1192 (+),score=284.58 gnl/Dysnectes_brevis/3517_a4463_1126:181-3576(+)